MRRTGPADRRRAAAERRGGEGDRRRGTVLEAVDEAVLVVDVDGRVLQANDAARGILGEDVADDGAGAGWWPALVALRAGPGAAVPTGAGVLRTGREARDVAVEISRADGTRASLSVNYLAWRTLDGVVGGLVLAFRDRTADARFERDRDARADERATGIRDFLQATLDSMPSTIAVLDARGEILMTNRAWVDYAAAQDVDARDLPTNYLDVCDAALGEDCAARTARGLRAIIAGTREELTVEYPCHEPDRARWFLLHATRYAGPGDARVVIFHFDVTERHLAQARVLSQAALLDEIHASVVATDVRGDVTDWNRGAEELYGWSRAEMLGRVVTSLSAADVASAAALEDGPAWARPGEWEGVGRHRDGSLFPVLTRNRLLHDSAGRVVGAARVSIDLTERVVADRELLLARNYVQAVADAMGEGLFTLAPDGTLTYVNEAAQAMLGWSRNELVGRVMHHVIQPREPGDDHAPAAGDSPIAQASVRGEKVCVDDARFRTRDEHDLRVAYTAAPFETDDGVEGCVVVFSDISERRAREEALRKDVDELAWIKRIQEGLAEDRFVLHAQPIVDVATGDVVQRELLIRLQGDDGELIAPGMFLGVAEQFGLIRDIDRWVIAQAIGIAARGHAVELNLSARSIGDDSILEHIERCLTESGADPALLVFEITETAIVEDQASARAFADRLHALGSRLALDDFGTGYGGFTYLKQLPVDFLKIDVEFVRDLATNPGSRHVVGAVVNLAHSFGLKTVAEGVEDAPTMALLSELGVDLAQGFHLGRPAPFGGAERAVGAEA